MRLVTIPYFALAATLFLTVFGAAHAQTDDDYSRAEVSALAGDASKMERAYDEILEQYPQDPRALVGRATARSWSGEYLTARADFRSVLERDPTHLAAWVGLGYNEAWAGETRSAERAFEEALSLAPKNMGAARGLAYTYLWSGRTAKALEAFEQLRVKQPRDIETIVAVGQTHLAMGHARRAESAFSNALSLEPRRQDALQGRMAARQIAPAFEGQIWLGNSVDDDQANLRQVDIASWVTRRTRLGARYDNSLSLDNPTLARSGIDAETLLVSGTHQFGDRFIGLLEAGSRDLPEGVSQDVYRTEGVILSGRSAVKIGGQLSPHSAGFDDTLVYAGVNFPLSQSTRLETTVFNSESGLAGDRETRGAVFAEYRALRGWRIAGSLGAGDIDSDFTPASGSVLAAHAVVTLPLGKGHELHLQIRHEDAPINEYTLGMVGITVRIPRN